MRTVVGELEMIVEGSLGVMRTRFVDVVAHQGAMQGVAVTVGLLGMPAFKRRLGLHVTVPGRRLNGSRHQTP